LHPVFDALGDDLELQVVRKVDDGEDDRRVPDVRGDVVDERPVDLQLVERKALQIRKARVPGAEIIYGDLHAETLQALQDGNRFFPVLDERALGKLELDQRRIRCARA